MSAYSDLLLATAGLVAYWRLGEASGTSAADEIGLHHGTYVGAPVLGEPGLLVGDTDRAVRFAVEPHGVSIPTFADFPWLTGWSFVALIKQDDFTGLSAGVAGVFGASPSGGFTFPACGGIYTRNGVSGVSFYNGTAYQQAEGGGNRIGLRAFIVGVYTGTQLVLYLDGAEVKRVTTIGEPRTATPQFTIGDQRPDFTNETMHGVIDEVALFSRALSAAEISDFYAAAITAFGSAALTGGGTVTPTGQKGGLTAYALTGGGAVSVMASTIRRLVAVLTGGGEVTSVGGIPDPGLRRMLASPRRMGRPPRA